MKHLERFQTDLQQVFGMLQCRGEKQKLQKYIQENRRFFEHVDVETYQAMLEFLQSRKMMKNITLTEKEDKIDMCKAMDEWYADAVREGKKAGEELGREKGRTEGRKAIIISMLSKGLSAEEIKSYTNGTDEEIECARKEMGD